MTLDLAVVTITILINAILGVMVVRHHPQTSSSRIFMVMIALIIVWSYANFRIDTSTTDAASLLWLKIFYAITFGFIALFLEFSHRFPFSRESILTRLLPFTHAIAGLIIFFTLTTDLVFVSATLGPAGLAALEFGPLYLLFSITALVGVSGGITELILKKRRSLSPARDQISFVVLGWFSFIACVVIVGAVLPFFIPAFVNLSKIGPLFSILMVGMTVYTIVRHNFLDIRFVLKNSLVYLSSLIAIVIFYAVLVSLFTLHEPSVDAIYLSAAITLILGIVGFPLLKETLSRLTDPLFFKESYDYAEAVQTLSNILYTHLEFNELQTKAEQCLAEYLHAEFVRIALRSRIPEEQHGATSFLGCGTLTVPIHLNEEEIGIIVVGNRRTNTPYERRDIQLLETFASQAATAFSRARLYEQTKQHADELARTVEERTRELRSAQEHERRMLVDLSHNLQTPLTVIQTRLDQLTPAKLTGEDARSLSLPLKRLSGFIYDLLSLAKLESEEPSTQDMVSLSELVDEIAEELTVIAGSKHVVIKTTIAPRLSVLGDARRLREAILNIASNAVKYLRDEGERRISLSLTQMNDEVHLRISDTGRGISSEDLPRIFDRFYRSSDTSMLPSGNGLGLPISKRIIEQHGGRLSIESVEGSGTSVHIYLPLRPTR
ncbi:MAG: ATP-binding protein [Patescibacteria group bacterium]